MRASAEDVGRGSGVKGGGERVSFRSVENKLDKWSNMLTPALDLAASFSCLILKIMGILFGCSLFLLSALILFGMLYSISVFFGLSL